MESASKRHPLITGTISTSLGTLVCRVLGLLRDMATAALLGLAGKNGVADAFLFAYRIPNLFRTLFGEGALMSGYLPVLTGQLERDRRVAWQLSSVVIVLLAALLAGLVAVGELLCGLVWLVWGDSPGMGLVLGLSAVMLPYLLLICIAAQLTTMLYASQRFAVPALAPATLSIVWLIAAWIGAKWFVGNQVAQAYLLAVAVVVSGVTQAAVQLPTLRRLGFRFDYHWAAAREGVLRIGRNMAPMFFGLAITQINTFVNNLIAMGLMAAKDGPQTISWLGGLVNYPMQSGAVASLYYGDRLVDFPLGIVGLPVAVAIFPLLSRHAACGDYRQLGSDMTLGLRMVMCLSVPAGVGLALLAQPITRLLFERGNFTPADTVRVGWVIVGYAAGVWASCIGPVIVRGFYALNDFGAPVRIGLWMLGLNLLLNLTLVWPLAELGLAASTSATAIVQVCLLAAIFSRRHARLDWRPLAATAARTIVASLVMAGAVHVAVAQTSNDGRLVSQLIRVGMPIAVGAAAYCGCYRLLGGRELGMLVSGKAAH